MSIAAVLVVVAVAVVVVGLVGVIALCFVLLRNSDGNRSPILIVAGLGCVVLFLAILIVGAAVGFAYLRHEGTAPAREPIPTPAPPEPGIALMRFQNDTH